MDEQSNEQINDKQTYQLKYVFSEAELRDKSNQLARVCSDKQRLEGEKKTIIADYKAKIESKIADQNLLSSHINNGYEYLFKSCDVVLDFATKTKTFYFEGEPVGTEPLTQEDYQLKINP